MKFKLRQRIDKDSISKIILIDLQKDIKNGYLTITKENLSKVKNNFFVLSEGIVLDKQRAKYRLQKLNNETYVFDEKEFCFLNIHNQNLDSSEIIKLSKYANVFGVSPFYLFIEDEFITPYEMFNLKFKKHADKKIVNEKLNKIVHILNLIDSEFNADLLSTQKFYNYFLVHRFAKQTNQNYIKVMYDLFAEKSKLKVGNKF